MKIIAYIGAALLILFGGLMVVGSFDPQGLPGYLYVGLIFIGVGLVVIFFVSRRPPQEHTTNVTYKVDLPADVKVDSLKCKSCGGVLSAENVTMVAGAPLVTCPFCHTAYQLIEEPKW